MEEQVNIPALPCCCFTRRIFQFWTLFGYWCLSVSRKWNIERGRVETQSQVRSKMCQEKKWNACSAV